MENLYALVIDNDPDEVKSRLEELKRRFQLTGVNFSYIIDDSAILGIERLSRDNTFDVVFLDIFGVDPYTSVIPQILHLNPYLPIIMLSRQSAGDEIIRCIDLGARSYIIKSELLIGVRALSPYDAWRDEAHWCQDLAKIKNAVNDYRPYKQVLNDSLEDGLMDKSGDANSVIEDQIRFLQYIQSKREIANYFPRVIKVWKQGADTYYQMPRFRMKLLRHFIFEEPNYENCLEISKHVVEEVLGFAFSYLYIEDRCDTYDKFVQETYFEKYKIRLQQTKDLLLNLKKESASAAIDVYEKLLDAKQINISGSELYNPTDILHKLENDESLKKHLQPPFLCMIHGDLHFGNILVNVDLPKKIRFKFIDPRGFSRPGYPLGVGDVAYDIGKLLHSAHGYYDFIHVGYLTTKVGTFKYPAKEEIEAPPLCWQAWATVSPGGGGSGAKVKAHQPVVQQGASDVFDKLAQHIREWIERSPHPQEDRHWRLRASFNEAMHFCTMGKFHLQEDVERAIAIQIRGIELMNEFLQQYRNGTFDS
jgi:thiamine kinase-like enzyme